MPPSIFHRLRTPNTLLTTVPLSLILWHGCMLTEWVQTCLWRGGQRTALHVGSCLLSCYRMSCCLALRTPGYAGPGFQEFCLRLLSHHRSVGVTAPATLSGSYIGLISTLHYPLLLSKHCTLSPAFDYCFKSLSTWVVEWLLFASLNTHWQKMNKVL